MGCTENQNTKGKLFSFVDVLTGRNLLDTNIESASIPSLHNLGSSIHTSNSVNCMYWMEKHAIMNIMYRNCVMI